jgi:ProP effector
MQAQWELLAIFRQRWPLVFPEDIRQVKPLARSIHQVIIEQLPDIKPWRIRGAIALFQRIGRGAYWRALVKGGPRYDLDGQPNGEVTAAEQEKARQDLEALAARRKAKGQGHPQTETAVSAAGENTTTSQEKPASAAEF